MGFAVDVQLNIPATPLFQEGRPAQIVNEEMGGATELAVNYLVARIVPLTPIDRGTLRAGMQTSVVGEGANFLGRVFNTLEYAPSVETGARPHFPPPDALEGWARRKLGKEGLGYVIARAISRRGTKGAFMFKRGLEASRSTIFSLYAVAEQRIWRRLNG